MQNMARELTETELKTIAGGASGAALPAFFRGLFGGPGDLRRPLDRP